MNVVEKVLGTPMAAPETRRMRRMRFAVITLAGMLAAGIPMVGALSALRGPVVTGGVLALLLLTTAATGATYFIRKSRLDDDWLDHLIAEREAVE